VLCCVVLCCPRDRLNTAEGLLDDHVWGEPMDELGWGLTHSGAWSTTSPSGQCRSLTVLTVCRLPLRHHTGMGYTWGPDVTAQWCEACNFDLIVRAQFTLEV
jgi:hypothetical protein